MVIGIYFGIGTSSGAFILLLFKVKLFSKCSNNMMALLVSTDLEII